MNINRSQENTFWKEFVNLESNPYRTDKISGLDCLFVFPTKKQDLSGWDYPLPLGYMSSILRMNNANAEITIQEVDSYNSDLFQKRDIIAFYPTTFLFEETMDLARKAKQENPNSKICFLNSDQHQHEMILCSPHARDISRKIMEKNKSIDFVLFGESEYSFLKLCENLAGKQDYSSVPACIYRREGSILETAIPIVPINFSFLPFASRDNLEKGIDGNTNVISPRVQSSRGCVSPCSYCIESSPNITPGGRKRAVLSREIGQFVDEIQMLQERYKVVFFNVIDSSFEDPGKKGLERMHKFCEEINERKIFASFKIHLRAETAKKLSYDSIDRLKNAGVDIIGVGVESGLEKELKSYSKITTPEISLGGIKKLEEQDKFFCVLGHMMFSPVLNLDDLPEKINFLKRLGHGWDYLDLSNNLLIFPGTEYHKRMASSGLILPFSEKSINLTIPYKFNDLRVESVAKEMGRLKTKIPSTIKLNSLFYDSSNLVARFTNPMNSHLSVNQESFEGFKTRLKQHMLETQEVYLEYFMSLIELAKNDLNKTSEGITKINIESFFPEKERQVRKNLDDFLEDCHSKSLATDRLYLKTWMSLINTQASIVGGKKA